MSLRDRADPMTNAKSAMRNAKCRRVRPDTRRPSPIANRKSKIANPRNVPPGQGRHASKRQLCRATRRSPIANRKSKIANVETLGYSRMSLRDRAVTRPNANCAGPPAPLQSQIANLKSQISLADGRFTSRTQTQGRKAHGAGRKGRAQRQQRLCVVRPSGR
jgi:hypothetical protein